MKKGRASSNSQKIQSGISTENTLINTDNQAMSGSSDTINSDAKATKTMIENYYISEKPRNYL